MTGHFLHVDVPATADNFDEAGYLALNKDVAENVLGTASDRWASGRAHFDKIGHMEGRSLRQLGLIAEMRARKLAKLAHNLTGSCGEANKLDYRPLKMRNVAGHPAPVSANMYDDHVLATINENRDGLVLDCGAGFRKIYYANVVNYEIVDYDTTDVLGLGESLPFNNETFDAVLSIAVLEHVRDPFTCAAELVRVLKPGGQLVCNVPFLQPYHGYPHHYYNMTEQGLRALFEDHVRIEFHEVVDSMLPVWTLTWIVQKWAEGLRDSREPFLDMTLRALLQPAEKLLPERWVRELPREKNFELASGTLLIGRKN